MCIRVYIYIYDIRASINRKSKCVCVLDHDNTFYENLDCMSYCFVNEVVHDMSYVFFQCIPKWHYINRMK